jgi:hypothetical protein
MRLAFRALALVLALTSAFACGGSSTTPQGGSGGGTGGQGGTPDPGPIDVPSVSASPLSMIESEPHVSASSDGRVAVAWIAIQATGESQIGYAISKDGGLTFGAPALTAMPAGLVATDPVMAADATGNIYLTWLGYTYSAGGYPSKMRLFVAKSAAGAAEFAAPVVAHAQTSDLYDKPWIVVTPNGTVLVVHTASDQQSYSHTVVSRSTDGGATWTTTTMPGEQFRSLPSLCVTSSSRVYATFIDANVTDNIAVQASDDDGATWGTAFRANGSDAIGYDCPFCVAEGSDVWVTYALGAGSTDTSAFQQMKSLRVAHSTDSGKTFGQKVDAHDPAVGPLFLHPAIARDSEGGIDVVYYGGKKSADPTGGIYLGRSTDGAATFAAATPLHTPIVFDLSRQDAGWLGDYIGVATQGAHLHVAYIDNTAQLAHVSYRRFIPGK